MNRAPGIDEAVRLELEAIVSRLETAWNTGDGGPGVALVHVESVMDAPGGPLKGRHIARFSMGLTRAEGGWEIAAFHNTLTPPGPSSGASPGN